MHKTRINHDCSVSNVTMIVLKERGWLSDMWRWLWHPRRDQQFWPFLTPSPFTLIHLSCQDRSWTSRPNEFAFFLFFPSYLNYSESLLNSINNIFNQRLYISFFFMRVWPCLCVLTSLCNFHLSFVVVASIEWCFAVFGSALFLSESVIDEL